MWDGWEEELVADADAAHGLELGLRLRVHQLVPALSP